MNDFFLLNYGNYKCILDNTFFCLFLYIFHSDKIIKILFQISFLLLPTSLGPHYTKWNFPGYNPTTERPGNGGRGINKQKKTNQIIGIDTQQPLFGRMAGRTSKFSFWCALICTFHLAHVFLRQHSTFQSTGCSWAAVDLSQALLS